MNYDEDEYPCVGICQAGEDGRCRGCGRPWETPVSYAPVPPQDASNSPPAEVAANAPH